MPQSSFFHLPQALVRGLCNIHTGDDLCKIKGLLYFVCSIFNENAVYHPVSQKKSDTLLLRILEYIENHYAADCSLSGLADALSYDYAYLSKFFIRSVGISFGEYIRRRRLSEACHLLTTTDFTVSEVSSICGFGSLRSMNRCFLELTGLTPRKYRQQGS